MLVSGVVPLLGPLLVALALGAVVANTSTAAAGRLALSSAAARTCLRAGIVLLGLRLPLGDLLGIGLGGAVVVVATVAITYGVTTAVGDALGVERGLVTLIAAGFSVCGAAAIAAVQDGVRARERHVAVAVALVTVYGTAMIAVIPVASRVLGLSTEHAALWAGASIHEVAQVVVAASLIGGPLAVALATTIKLGRVLTLAGVYLVAAGREGRQSATSAPVVPWFVAGFVIAVAVRATGVVGPVALDLADAATTLLLAAGMFGLGLGLRVRDLWPLPAGVLTLATVATSTAAGTSLLLILGTSALAS